MATTGALGVEADVATRVDTAIAAGAGPHLPVGQWSGADYRSAMRFAIPAGWAGWTAITKATLKFYISDFQHVGPRNSSIFCSRMNVSGLWTKGAGSQSCDSGFTGANTTQSDDIQSVSTDRVTFSSGTTENAAKSIDVTAAVRYYWANGASKIVFVFDNNGSGEYTEIWADEKSGYDATLVIDYDVQSAPNAPTVTAPAAGAAVVSATPTFSWTHSDPQGDAQANAEVRVYDAAGTTLLFTWPVAGAAASLVAPTALTRGTTYQFEVRTADAVNGFGPYSAKRSFSIKALPVVTVDATRRQEFGAGAPRLRVNWTSDQAQVKYRVQAGAFDSGWLTGAAQTYRLDTVALVSGTPVSVTVSVETADPLQGSAVRSFTPRYGLTTQRRDLTTAPVNWGTPSITATVPTDASLVIEYGSDPAANAAPASGWFSTLSSVPKARYLFYRAWLIPSSVAGPTLDRIDIPADSTVTLVDKWGTTRNAPGLAAPFAVDPGEYVYGTRSLRADITGAGPFYCYAYSVSVRAGRNYILTGLMKSLGNSGATLELQDAAGNTLIGGGMSLPVGPVRTAILTATADWFTTDQRDVVRYRTPVYLAPSDMTVFVVAKAGGTAGAKAWWDAVKLEESTVATPWSPGAVGATVVDAGGVQVDGAKGGVFRLRGTDGAPRSIVESGPKGLTFGGDTELTSPSAGVLAVNGTPLMPPGAVTAYVANAAPSGWLLCDGASYARSAYPDLFAIIGVTYGSVDGASFSVPDLRQRLPLGKAASGTGSALAQSGGAIDHTHAGPSHTHGLGAGYAQTTAGTDGVQTSLATGLASWTPNRTRLWATPTTPAAAAKTEGARLGGTTDADGTAATAAGNPPFLVVNYIIKT